VFVFIFLYKKNYSKGPTLHWFECNKLEPLKKSLKFERYG